MRQLQDSELFSKYIKKSNELINILNNKVYQGVGEIAPKHIETEMLILKNASKNSYMPLLPDAISLFENFNGRIRLFNLGSTSGGRVPVPGFFPEFLGRARYRVNENESNPAAGTTPAIFMNMYRIGQWNDDESTYKGLNAKTDLYSCLESGVIMYKLLAEGKAKEVFSNETILKYLTSIYTHMFSSIMTKTAGASYGMGTFQDDAARFLIAKFFLKYVMQRADSEINNDLAYSTIKHFSTLGALKNYEETANIDYSSLTGFLSSFGQLFFNKDISLSSFDSKWALTFGEGLILAIEYVPYLIHFLFASIHGSTLGGSSKLYAWINDLKENGLLKLYNLVVSAIK